MFVYDAIASIDTYIVNRFIELSGDDSTVLYGLLTTFVWEIADKSVIKDEQWADNTKHRLQYVL